MLFDALLSASERPGKLPSPRAAPIDLAAVCADVARPVAAHNHRRANLGRDDLNLHPCRAVAHRQHKPPLKLNAKVNKESALCRRRYWGWGWGHWRRRWRVSAAMDLDCEQLVHFEARVHPKGICRANHSAVSTIKACSLDNLPRAAECAHGRVGASERASVR